MSSAGLPTTQDPELYRWNSDLYPDDYVFAHYQISAACSGEEAALGMAMEQSVGASRIHTYLQAETLAQSCIRVVQVRALEHSHSSAVRLYHLSTPIYGNHQNVLNSYQITLAFPLRLLASKPAQLLNILIGELPRLGFISRFQLCEIQLPPLSKDFAPGPAFGMQGLRRLSQQADTPLLCRSMRPAVGLDLATMAELNRAVLCGGFHIVKDDELIAFPDFAQFRLHVLAMLAARDFAIAHTREKKLYFATLICEPWELQERWEFCCDHGVDGVLIAPWIQGIGLLPHLARQGRLPILAHNTMGELMTRHPDWKIDETVVNRLWRALGADLLVMSGDSATTDADQQRDLALMLSITEPDQGHQAACPILQGGKTPSELPLYRQCAGGNDFMLIVASWVDNYEAGLAEGAAAFRQALTATTDANHV